MNKSKDWTDADTVATTVISIISICIILGTLIDVALRHGASDFFPDKAVVSFQGFSLYTTFKKIFQPNGWFPSMN